MHDRVTQIYATPQLSAAQLATFAEALGCVVNGCIEVLDLIAGNPDLEDATDLEDEGIAPWTLHKRDGPGCTASDIGEDDDPDSEHDGREVEHEL